jgi:hypothetical protein
MTLRIMFTIITIILFTIVNIIIITIMIRANSTKTSYALYYVHGKLCISVIH